MALARAGGSVARSVRMATGKSAPLGGGQRDWELHLLLRRAVMVRRRKADVLAELPPKRRRWLRVPLTGADAAAAAAEAEVAGGGSAVDDDDGAEVGEAMVEAMMEGGVSGGAAGEEEEEAVGEEDEEAVAVSESARPVGNEGGTAVTYARANMALALASSATIVEAHKRTIEEMEAGWVQPATFR